MSNKRLDCKSYMCNNYNITTVRHGRIIALAL